MAHISLPLRTLTGMQQQNQLKVTVLMSIPAIVLVLVKQEMVLQLRIQNSQKMIRYKLLKTRLQATNKVVKDTYLGKRLLEHN